MRRTSRFVIACWLGIACPLPSAAQPPIPPAASHTLVVNLWSFRESTPEGQELLRKLATGETRRQSRDFSDEILQAVVDGKVKPAAGCHQFHVEFLDIAIAASIEATVWGHRELQGVERPIELMRLEDTGVDISVCWGSGLLIIPVRPPWATTKMAATVYSPFHAPVIRYPISGSLKTCGPATAGRCGGVVTEPTLLYQRLQRRGTSHFHFVVD